MAAPNLDPTVDAVAAAVEQAVGTNASVLAFIAGVGAKILAAVTKALEEDDAADQGTIDAATAAVNAKLAELTASSAAVAAAIEANP